MSFFEELKRRKVFRVAATYAVVAWILMQIGEVTFPALNIPEWVMSTLVVVLLAGFPIAVIFAWIFDKTPQGFIKTDATETENIGGMNVKVDDRPLYLQKRNIFLALGVIAGILIGTYVLSAGYYDAYYLRAQKVRTKIVEDFNRAFNNCDAILTPTAPTGAFKIGEKNVDPVTMYMNDVFTVPASLAGLPAMSVPSGMSQEALPLGLQVIGKPFDEQTILNLSLAIEKRANFKKNFKVWWI